MLIAVIVIVVVCILGVVVVASHPINDISLLLTVIDVCYVKFQVWMVHTIHIGMLPSYMYTYLASYIGMS